MIRGVVIHIMNEQPLMADLYGPPTAADVGLLCTNLRTLDGKRPVFIDRSDGFFFFPYLNIRFLEIPQHALNLPALEGGNGDIDWRDADAAGTAAEGTGDGNGHVEDFDLDADLELDEDVLRRIRDL
jgi:hypothetical protein